VRKGCRNMGQAGPKRSPTIMVVDDSDDLRELIGVHLRILGYQIVEAANGLEAIEVARRTCPSLILMDINMPLLDGLAATRIIRKTEQLSNTVIVAFSAYLSGGNRESALAAGCNGYVTKMECVDQLPQILQRFAPIP
jgi:two-component system, cell cycle response regulator DivK